VLVKSNIGDIGELITRVQGECGYIGATDATSAGEGDINIVFEPGTDPNQAVISPPPWWKTGDQGNACCQELDATRRGNHLRDPAGVC